MTILLDIDDVLVTTPAWRVVELEANGFMKFNERAAANLARILKETEASIVLTTTHRINYTIDQWRALLNARGIFPVSIAKVNDLVSINDRVDRASELEEWVNKQTGNETYVIIDDDLSVHRLPNRIKERWVITKPLIGLDEEATDKALQLLKQDTSDASDFFVNIV